MAQTTELQRIARKIGSECERISIFVAIVGRPKLVVLSTTPANCTVRTILDTVLGEARASAPFGGSDHVLIYNGMVIPESMSLSGMYNIRDEDVVIIAPSSMGAALLGTGIAKRPRPSRYIIPLPRDERPPEGTSRRFLRRFIAESLAGAEDAADYFSEGLAKAVQNCCKKDLPVPQLGGARERLTDEQEGSSSESSSSGGQSRSESSRTSSDDSDDDDDYVISHRFGFSSDGYVADAEEAHDDGRGASEFF